MASKSSQPLLLQTHKEKDFWDLEWILGYLGQKFGKLIFAYSLTFQWQMRKKYEFLKSCFFTLQMPQTHAQITAF